MTNAAPQPVPTISHGARGTSRVALTVDSKCELGECVLWDERRAALFWTDITVRRLWMHRPAAGEARQWEVPEPLGCFALCEDGRLLLGLAKGLHLAEFDDAGGALTLHPVAAVEAGLAHTRINDGRCDRDGNFVFGTKCESAGATVRGSFYQFSFAHGLRRLALPDVSIPNSICFSRDGRTLYFCDSTQPVILCCDYEPRTATVARVRTFASLDAAGEPDGSCIDAHGCLWNAQWGAGRVVQYLPDGMLGAVVPVPAKNPTCCAFGGAGLDRMYVSSARADTSADELAAMPHAGGIFEFAVGAGAGLAESRIRLR